MWRFAKPHQGKAFRLKAGGLLADGATGTISKVPSVFFKARACIHGGLGLGYVGHGVLLFY